MSPQRLVIATLACALSAAGVAQAGDKAGKLQGYDGLGRPGEAVEVKAKLERVIKGLSLINVNPDVEGESLAFYLTEKPITDARYRVALEEAEYLGKAKTNASGIAKVDFTPERTGVYVIEARVRKGSEYIALPAPLQVGSYGAEDDIVVVDLDLTVSDTSSLQVTITDTDSIGLQEGALEGLRRIVFDQQRPVVYVSSQDDTFLNTTRGWMAKRELPPGPLFVWDFWAKSWSEETFKTQLVKALRKGFTNMNTGIGDLNADADAYLANGMTAHILQAVRDDDLSPNAVHASSWVRLVEHLEAQREVEGWARTFARGDLVERLEAWERMSRVGPELRGYVARMRGDTEVETASAATLIMGRVAAREAFAQTLDLSSPSRALSALIASWSQGDAWVMAQLYREPEVAVSDCAPPVFPVGKVEVVSMAEPNETTLVYTLKVSSAREDRRPVEVEVKLTQGEDGRWLRETPDF